MGSSKTGSKGCWLLVNERVHRGFSSSLLLTFSCNCNICLCLFLNVCVCVYFFVCVSVSMLAVWHVQNLGYLKLARQLQGQFISWFGTEFPTFCSVVNIQDCLFHTGIWGGYGRHHGERFT